MWSLLRLLSVSLSLLSVPVTVVGDGFNKTVPISKFSFGLISPQSRSSAVKARRVTAPGGTSPPL